MARVELLKSLYSDPVRAQSTMDNVFKQNTITLIAILHEAVYC